MCSGLLDCLFSRRPTGEEQSCETESDGEELPHLLLSGGRPLSSGERYEQYVVCVGQLKYVYTVVETFQGTLTLTLSWKEYVSV